MQTKLGRPIGSGEGFRFAVTTSVVPRLSSTAKKQRGTLLSPGSPLRSWFLCFFAVEEPFARFAVGPHCIEPRKQVLSTKVFDSRDLWETTDDAEWKTQKRLYGEWEPRVPSCGELASSPFCPTHSGSRRIPIGFGDSYEFALIGMFGPRIPGPGGPGYGDWAGQL